MKTIQFAGQTFVLDVSGMLIWPEQRIAVVADLHLEKATYFAKQGQLLPPQESYETLSKLLTALDKSKCSSLILLGDSFHDADGFDRLESKACTLWERLCKEYAVTFILGNHDGLFAPPQTQSKNELELNGITFRHQAVPEASAEISGHYHPKASLKVNGKRICRPCFVADTNRMILPSFGTLTGGMDIKSVEIAEHFLLEHTVHLLGESKIYSVPASSI